MQFMLPATCKNALAPKQIQKVVKEFKESEDRGNNVMIYGLSEETDENLQVKVGKVFEALVVKPFSALPVDWVMPQRGRFAQ